MTKLNKKEVRKALKDLGYKCSIRVHKDNYIFSDITLKTVDGDMQVMGSALLSQERYERHRKMIEASGSIVLNTEDGNVWVTCSSGPSAEAYEKHKAAFIICLNYDRMSEE